MPHHLREPVAKGVRRIVAYTGHRAIESVREAEALLKELSQVLKTPQPQDLPRRAAQLQDEVKQLRQELVQYTRASVADQAAEFLKEADEVNGVKVVCRRVDAGDRDILREYADQLRSGGQDVCLLLATEVDGKVALIAAVSKDLTKKGVKAGDCVREAAKAVGGGGGGRPDLAEAGGKDPSKIDDALAAATQFYTEKLSAAAQA